MSNLSSFNTIVNDIDNGPDLIYNSTELNHSPLNEVRNMNLYKQFSAILLNEHTFKTRLYEEIDNRRNKNSKNAMLELKLERSIKKECSIDFKESIRCTYLFLYNIYTLLIPPNYRSRTYAIEIFTTIFYDTFNVKGNPIKTEKFKNIYYLRQNRIRKTIEKKSLMSHDEISKINLLKQFESCKTPVFLTLFTNN
uniref:Uncharacterized protein n=1 Tax=Strongyloides venezuelensis TaxID=75913 RepID=A0A0K0G5Z8_STRVS